MAAGGRQIDDALDRVFREAYEYLRALSGINPALAGRRPPWENPYHPFAGPMYPPPAAPQPYPPFATAMFHPRFYGLSIGQLMAETEEDRRRREVAEAERRAAVTRAEALLETRLGRKEYLLFSTTRAITRPSRLWPDVQYIIPREASDRVTVVRNGRVTTELCVVNANGEPPADRILTILDLLETDEMKLWGMANVFPFSGPETGLPTIGAPGGATTHGVAETFLRWTLAELRSPHARPFILAWLGLAAGTLLALLALWLF